jgi:hypothetical protein
MQKTVFNPAQNITCFDLENTTWENLHLSALKLGLCSSQIDLLKLQFDDVQLKKDNNIEFYINKIYADKDTLILGTITHCYDLIAEFLVIDLETLHAFTFEKYFKKQFQIMLDDTDFEILEKINQHNVYNLSYQWDYLNVQVNNSDLLPSDLEKLLNTTLHFSETVNSTDLHHLKLINVIYKNRVPVVFYFKSTATSKVHLAWSSKFIEAILAIQPINNEKINKEVVLNTILDAINCKGIDQLTEYQKKFLQEY